MVFKDILVNYSKSSKERLEFVSNELNKLKANERIIFVGDTFYTNDLNLSYFVEFISELNRHKDHKFYIQDVESLSAKLMNTKVKSWYSLPSWPSHVSLYLTTEEIEASSTELRSALTYRDLYDESKFESPKDLDEDLEEEMKNQETLYLEHEEDLIGSFIDEVNELDYIPAKKASIIKIGLDALLRRWLDDYN